MHINVNIANIEADDVKAAVSRYELLVPEDLKALDEQRYQIIPATVTERKGKVQEEKSDELYITREELITLMQWKLKHGTFRPRLLDLVKSNTSEDVQRQSGAAFRHQSMSKGEAKLPNGTVADDPIVVLIQAMQHLEKLKGVGPATASLVLSVYDPHNNPFLSDALAQWMYATAEPLAVDPNDQMNPWKRKLQYNAKDFRNTAATIANYRPGEGRLRENRNKSPQDVSQSVSCVDLEKTAWVLCREDANLKMKPGKPDSRHTSQSGQDASKTGAKRTTQKDVTNSKGAKKEASPAPEQQRRSKRLKITSQKG